MSTTYHSFLICFHPSHTDVYRNGLPLGVIRDGKFKIHERTMPDGKNVPVEIPATLAGEVEEVTRLMRSQAAQPLEYRWGEPMDMQAYLDAKASL